MAENKSRRRKLKRVLLFSAGAILALLVIGFIVLWVLSPGKASPVLDADGKPVPGSISEIVRMDIGGVEQGMIIKGVSDKNPVLLFLHGGPGSPEYMFEATYPTHMEREFTVCWWEQRDAGMSYSANIPKESLTVSQMISDTVEVTNYLRERFGQEKIYIMGHSWGSYLGMHVVAQYPELYTAYIGVGQLSDQFESEKLAYAYMLDTARKTGDTSFARRLEKFTINSSEDLNAEYMMLRSEGMNKQGIGITHNMKSFFAEFILPLLYLPEYTLADKINYPIGNAMGVDTPMWETCSSDNLMQTIPSVEVPVYIIQGKYDYQVSHDLAKEYSQMLQAPEVHFYTFENSAHSPCFEEPERFMQIMREDVLKEK